MPVTSSYPRLPSLEVLASELWMSEQLQATGRGVGLAPALTSAPTAVMAPAQALCPGPPILAAR